MVGGTKFSLQNQFNRAWQAHRQPGSSFKAYVYTAAIDRGYRLRPRSTIRRELSDGRRYAWSPYDDDGRYMGDDHAALGVNAVAQRRRRQACRTRRRRPRDRVRAPHGRHVRLDANLSLALGSSVVSVLDQASGYSTLANQGLHVDPTPFRLVRDSLGTSCSTNVIRKPPTWSSAGTAYIVTSMMQDVINRGTGYPNAVIGRPAAGKRERPRTFATRGSSDSHPTSSPPCGSATTITRT